MKNLLRKNPLAIIIVIGLLLLGIISAVILIYRQNTVEIELRIAPASATVLIDGKKYQNGTFRIKPGTYTIKIEKEGFTTKEYQFNTDTTKKIYDYILQTDGSYSWYLNHSEDAELLTSIGDYEANLEATAYNDKHKIVYSLPIIYANYDKDYNYTEYRIDGGSFDGCNTDFCLKVTDTTGGNLDNAKQKIKDAGFNPDDYQILYQYTPIIPLD